MLSYTVDYLMCIMEIVYDVMFLLIYSTHNLLDF